MLVYRPQDGENLFLSDSSYLGSCAPCLLYHSLDIVIWWIAYLSSKMLCARWWISRYALLGAASFLGGSMRMTVSLCVIMVEITNNLKLLPLIMLVLLISKVCLLNCLEYFLMDVFWNC